MKKIKNKCSRLFSGLLGLFLMTSCSNLDYTNKGTITPDNVWSDKNLIYGFFTDIHGSMMPGWPVNGNSSDEGMNSPGSMGNYLRGIIDVEANGYGFSYTNIDKINFFLSKLPTVAPTVLTDQEKSELKGQALFWRAWDYWGKVSMVGGVPLILEPQNVGDLESLFIPRNKTSECVTQIIQDLDDAIAALPAAWDNKNYGRIDKGAAMAFKGKVLMWYASPMFNPSNDKARWDAAYKANKEAVEFLQGAGKGLLSDYAQIWKSERNEEVIMVNQFYYPDHTFSNNGIRPEPLTKDNSNQNQPILPLLMAYPKKDGSSLTLDINRLKTDPAYNEAFLTDFYNNRDNRFNATIFCGGTEYPTPDRNTFLSGGQRYWCTWIYDEGKYVSMVPNQLGRSVGAGVSGFFSLKGLDESLDQVHVHDGAVDWVEFRFAEVLMNYGECANEVDKKEEALSVLYQIRERASIETGNGQYGITASTKNEIREAYLSERFVEFAFEGKRFGDLRRWKRFDVLNKLQYREGLYIVLNDNNDLNGFNWTGDIKTSEVREKFHAVYIENLDGDSKYKFNLDLNHWFYPIAKNDLDRNSKLEQNNEWGGTFDPLQ